MKRSRFLLAAWVAAVVAGDGPSAEDGVRARPAPPVADGAGRRDLTIAVDRPIVVFEGPRTTQVTLTATPSHFAPTTYNWSRVPDRINPLDSAGKVTFSANGRGASKTTATFSAPGVYQIRLSAGADEDATRTHAWVNVWDSKSVLQGGTPIGMYPDVAPPAVRALSADPGPFQHPRVLFSDADWPEMTRRAAKGKVSSFAVGVLKRWVAQSLDDPKTPIGKIADQLNAYALKGGSGPAPDLSYVLDHGSVLSSQGNASFFGVLLDACYLAWLDQDPTVARAQVPPAKQKRARALARVTGAAAKVYLDQVWDRRAGKFRTGSPFFDRNMDVPGEVVGADRFVDLAMAYDLIHDWMEPAQRKDARDFLYAMSYGRHSSNNARIRQGPDAGKAEPGMHQNGDFANLNDDAMLVAMAIEGEEGEVSADVRKAFGVARPKGQAVAWSRPADPKDPSAWPNATRASVDNLERQVRWMQDWFVSPWGFTVNYTAYFSLSAKYFFPPALAVARRGGENLFVTSYLYPAVLAYFYPLAPGEAPSRSPIGTSSVYLWDHHDSMAHDYRGTCLYLWKYMYPDDALVDYAYRAFLPSQHRNGNLNDPFVAAVFGLDPGVGGKVPTLAEVAEAKRLPPTKFDPQRGVVVARNGWGEDDATLWFDCAGDAYTGHMHAERDSFAFFAMGRAWSIAPGYHCTISDLQAAVLIQDPRLAGDRATKGYIGEGPSSATQMPPRPGNFPTPPGRMLEVAEGPKHQWTLMAGDATACYKYGYSGPRKLDTGIPLSRFMYPGVFDAFCARQPLCRRPFSENLMVSQDDYNPVRYAIRSILFVRGRRPYALVVDDIRKDDGPHNYRWSMNCAVAFAPGSDNRFVDARGSGVYSSLAMMPGATATDAVLYHSPIDDEKSAGQAGLPRLLLRDVSERPAGPQPAIVLESRPPNVPGTDYLTYGYDNNRKEKTPSVVPSNRVLIERDNVAEPKYKVLLFPYRTGEPLPVTSWDNAHARLTVDLKNGTTDTLTFDRAQGDHRTRIAFTRAPGPGERVPGP